jgi:hypothetical protein
MLKSIRQFFQQLSPEQQQQSDPLSVEMATAALLFEIMRADDDFDPKEVLEVRNLRPNCGENDKKAGINAPPTKKHAGVTMTNWLLQQAPCP